MSGQSKQRAGKERIESLGIPKPRWIQWWERSDKGDWGLRVGIVLIAAVAMLLFCQTWRPPFAFRSGSIPAREVITRVRLDVPDEAMTNARREEKRREEFAIYRNRPQPINQLRAALRDQLFLILAADSFDQLSPEGRAAFLQFYEASEADPAADTTSQRFAKLKNTLATDPELKQVDDALAVALAPTLETGLLKSLQHTIEQGNQRVIRVYQAGRPDESEPVEVSRVRITEAGREFTQRLKEQFRQRFQGDDGQVVGQMLADWIVRRLPDNETLQYDDAASENARQAAAARVEPVMTAFFTGKSKLADAGKPLTPQQVELLRMEWQVLVDKMRWTDKLARMVAYGGMITAFSMLCGSYIFFVGDRRLLMDRRRLAKLMTLVTATIMVGYAASQDQWRCELIPLVIASIITAVVYGRELAILLMAAICVSLTLFLGESLADLVVMAAACTSCTLLVGRIRTRSHLLYVGAAAAVITMLTVVGVGLVTGQTLSGGVVGSDLEPLYRGPQFDVVIATLCRQALWAGGCVLFSAATTTPFLGFVEKAFGVQTDLSLLEMGDASHALLRRLAQRAPGTYNHSINVASIAEAAADAIGANGLLVRVGAYFHDIGKMFKPEYFIENQSGGVNQHDSLQPAMSTLVIIAHVKDGADLARSHHLPESIIDFIQQHHGTTLVEYFYREAARRSEEDPNREAVSAQDFRYPGPKPQTLEAAVLMLADTVESASRTLVDPTPARIQGLVDSIAQKKVGDGQFDECGMTFRQLHRVRQSLVKSLTAIYHARVKYPGQQSA